MGSGPLGGEEEEGEQVPGRRERRGGRWGVGPLGRGRGGGGGGKQASWGGGGGGEVGRGGGGGEVGSLGGGGGETAGPLGGGQEAVGRGHAGEQVRKDTSGLPGPLPGPWQAHPHS